MHLQCDAEAPAPGRNSACAAIARATYQGFKLQAPLASYLPAQRLSTILPRLQLSSLEPLGRELNPVVPDREPRLRCPHGVLKLRAKLAVGGGGAVRLTLPCMPAPAYKATSLPLARVMFRLGGERLSPPASTLVSAVPASMCKPRICKEAGGYQMCVASRAGAHRHGVSSRHSARCLSQ